MLKTTSLAMVLIFIACVHPSFADNMLFDRNNALPHLILASATVSEPDDAAQTAPVLDGYFGINWRDSKDVVLKKMTAVSYSKTSDESGISSYTPADGTKVGGELVDNIGVYTCSSGASKVVLSFQKNDNDVDVIPQYNTVKKLLIAKYGTPTSDTRTFDDPYFDGDGYSALAISAGRGHYLCKWSIESSSGEDCAISITITEALQVTVSYENEPLMNKYNDEQSKADASQL
jgi:hypothetical protein